MKKILFSILIVLLLALCCITVWKGINVFGIEILGFSGIQEKNTNLDNTISEATKLASTDYEKALSDMETDIKKLQEEKKNYQDLVTVNEGSEVKVTNQYQKYEIEYLWAIIGNHATSEGIELKMDLVAGSSQNLYNLNFTVNGSYIGIADFISSIENDPVLGFKIENFNMTGSDKLQATFTCKDIEIKEISNAAVNTKTDNKNTNTNTDKTTNSNSANTNTTNNTTNGNSANTNTTNSTTNSTDNTDSMIKDIT